MIVHRIETTSRQASCDRSPGAAVAVAEDEAVYEHAVVQIGRLGPSRADRGVAEALPTRHEMTSVVRV